MPKAILIGVDGYSFAPLGSAVNDALAMADALTGGDGAAAILAPDDITLFLAPANGAALPANATLATRDAILDALHPHYAGEDPVDLLIVYFAGHGMSVSRDGRTSEALILPVDVEGPDRGRNMIPVDELVRLFAMRGPLAQVFIFDACRDMPFERRPRGFSIDWNEEPPQTPRRQARIHAVAQGGVALGETAGMGRFTRHLLDGLKGEGCALDHQPGVGHLVTAKSLFTYARRRVEEALEGYDAYTQAIQLPQLATGAEPIVLRPLPPPGRRPFAVAIEPEAARPDVVVSLEVEPSFPVPGWPPDALPRIYELRAALRPGVTDWSEPTPSLVAVDLREEDRVEIRLTPLHAPVAPFPGPVDHDVFADRLRERRPFGVDGDMDLGEDFDAGEGVSPFPEAASGGAVEPAAPARKPDLTDRFGVAPALTRERETMGRPNHLRPPTGPEPAFLTVEAVDPGARVLLSAPEGDGAPIEAQPGERVVLAAGAWDIRVELGGDTISETRVVLGPYERRVVTATAQITPALAALLPGDIDTTGPPPVSIMPSESIGPMQGAIMPTLLPVLALKPIDADDELLHQFAHLDIPPARLDPNGLLAIAIAHEGTSPGKPPPVPGPDAARYAFRHASGRLSLFLTPIGDERHRVEVDLGDGRVLDIAAPRLPDAVTVAAVRLWPNGRVETTLHLFHLPIGTMWGASASSGPPAGMIARATALAARVFEAGGDLTEVPHFLALDVAYAKWLDPVLGVLAFHGFAQRLRASADDPAEAAPLRDMLAAIISNMTTHFAPLADSRIMAAFSEDEAEWHANLAPLLDDRALGQPVVGASLARLADAAIAHGLDNHWAVERFDHLRPGEVFNVVTRQKGRA